MMHGPTNIKLHYCCLNTVTDIQYGWEAELYQVCIGLMFWLMFINVSKVKVWHVVGWPYRKGYPVTCNRRRREGVELQP